MEKTSEQVYSDLLLQLGNPTIVEPDVLVGYLRDVERMYSMGHITEWQLQRARNAYEATIERDPRQGPPSGFGTLVGDRVVHRTVDSSGRMTASTEAVCPPITGANRSGMNLWGIEPDFAD